MPTRLGLASSALLLLACSDPAPAPSAPPSAPPPPTSALPRPPRVESFTLTQAVQSTVEGAPAMLLAVSAGDADHPATADLTLGDERLTVVAGGCASSSLGALAIDRVDLGPAAWAHFRWTPAGSEVDGADQLAHDAPVGTVITSGPWRVRVTSIEPQPGGLTRVWIAFSSPSFDAGAEHRVDVELAEGAHAENVLTGVQSVDVGLGASDPVGCATPRVTIIDPSTLVVDVADGASTSIRAGTTIRLGEATVRYDGTGEGRTTTGDRALFFLTLAPGTDHEQTSTCSLEEPCVGGGLSIEWVSNDQAPLVTLRVRRAQ